MKTFSVLLVLSFLIPSLSFAKRRRTSNFQRRHAVVLNTQRFFEYSESSSEGFFNLAYAYNMGNFELQPYLAFNIEKDDFDTQIKELQLGLNLHLNIIENRRGKRWIPYILIGGAYYQPNKGVSTFKVDAGGGIKYFLTSRLVLNPEIFYGYELALSDDEEPDKKIKAHINFRYYF